MSKLIITHHNPDPDAITSVWLLRRFDQEWSEAGVAFVPAGDTYQNKLVDSDPDIAHVDTGKGQFDHHQTSERTCAAQKIYQHLASRFDYIAEDEALERLVKVIVGDDHFDEVIWPNPLADYYTFMLAPILDGLKHNNTLTDQGLIDLGSTCLDGIYTSMKLKIEAEKEIEKGRQFETQWGKAIAIESKNDETLTVAQKLGYILVIRKDPQGMIRIKARPDSQVDLTYVWEKVKTADPQATWYLHPSKKMLLNGSYKNPNSIFSNLEIEDIINCF